MRVLCAESRLLTPSIVFVFALIVDSIRKCQIEATFFGSGDNACPCYYSMLRPASACPRLECTTGYHSSCYSQCQKRKRREVALLPGGGVITTDNDSTASTFHINKINKCNNIRLQRLIESTMPANENLESVKMRILKYGESFLHTPLNVICSEGEPLSYVTVTSSYCLVTKGNRSCYAFTAPSRSRIRAVVNEDSQQ